MLSNVLICSVHAWEVRRAAFHISPPPFYPPPLLPHTLHPHQVPVLVDLVCDTKGPGRSGALHLLRVLCSLDEAMRVHLCKSKPLHKAVLKGADQYEKGSIDFENCAKLYIMLTETAGEQ